MREILFRGKDLESGEWVEGAYFPQNDTYPATIFVGKRHSIGHYVDENTVGQYTGLTDKNGTKIFEWDILQRDDECKWVVSFHKVMFAAQRYKYPIHRLSTQYWCKHSVIGNIHDNPELAKEKGRG